MSSRPVVIVRATASIGDDGCGSDGAVMWSVVGRDSGAPTPKLRIPHTLVCMPHIDPGLEVVNGLRSGCPDEMADGDDVVSPWSLESLVRLHRAL